MALDVKSKWNVTAQLADYANRGSHLEITFTGLENSIVEFVDPTVTIKLGSVFELNGFFVTAVSDTELNYVGGVKYIHVLDLGSETVSVSLEDSAGIWDDQKNGYYETGDIRVLNWRFDSDGAFRRLDHNVTSNGSFLPVVLNDGALKITADSVHEGNLTIKRIAPTITLEPPIGSVGGQARSTISHFRSDGVFKYTVRLNEFNQWEVYDQEFGATIINVGDDRVLINRPLETAKGIFNNSLFGAHPYLDLYNGLKGFIPNINNEMILAGGWNIIIGSHAKRTSSTVITIFGVSTAAGSAFSRAITASDNTVAVMSIAW